MFNPFRKKVKVPEGVAFTPAQSITQKYIDAYMAEAERNRIICGVSNEDIEVELLEPLRYLLREPSVVCYPDPSDVEISIPMKIEPCAYCGSRCVADYRGNCRACGAPKGN